MAAWGRGARGECGGRGVVAWWGGGRRGEAEILTFSRGGRSLAACGGLRFGDERKTGSVVG